MGIPTSVRSSPIHEQHTHPYFEHGHDLQWPSSSTVIFSALRMHLLPAAVPCSNAKPNTTSLSSYSNRKLPSPITVTSSIRTSTPPQRRQRSTRLRRHHPTRRKDHPYNSRKITYSSVKHLEDPDVLIEASNLGRDTSDVGVRAGVYLVERDLPIREGPRDRVSGARSILLRALSSDRPLLMRLRHKSQKADIRKEATSILS